MVSYFYTRAIIRTSFWKQIYCYSNGITNFYCSKFQPFKVFHIGISMKDSFSYRKKEGDSGSEADEVSNDANLNESTFNLDNLV